MDDLKLSRAKGMRSTLDAYKKTVQSFRTHPNLWGLPAEMFNRHKAEVLAWLEADMAEMQSEYDGL